MVRILPLTYSQQTRRHRHNTVSDYDTPLFVYLTGYLKEIHRSDDFVVVCHVPELTEADLPTLSLKRK